MTKISEHFTLEEFTNSQTAKRLKIGNTPNEDAVANICVLVQKVLEPARQKFGKPIVISSGYRCPLLNKAVGGKKTSKHLYGCAADLQTRDEGDLQKLFDVLKEGEYDQLLFEKNKQGKRWIHVSYVVGKNRKMIDENYNA